MKRFLQRHALWFGFLAVLVPLGILMGLQYHWLVDLSGKSALAREAYLDSYLKSISSRVEYHYRKQAERSLNVPGSLFTEGRLRKLPYYFQKKQPEGARLLFAVDFTEGDWGRVHYYDPADGNTEPPTDPALLRAVGVAVAPWKAICAKKAPIKSHGIVVEERDPDRPILLNPITDGGCSPVGVAGMVIDAEHFRREVLPVAVDETLVKFCDRGGDPTVSVTARDRHGDWVIPPTDSPDHPPAGANGSIPFVFSDYQLAVSSSVSPAQLAKSNFVLNITLSGLLALLLLGGITLALRTASREIWLSRMKSDFVSNVSHELRTPLASIRVFGEFLRLGRVRSEDKIHEYGEYIETESRRLTQLIDNILDFSKIESGAKTYEFESTQLRDVVEQALSNLEVGLKHRGFRLRYESPEQTLPPVQLDAAAISQAVANLVDNAVKYSNGCREVTVRLAPGENEVRIEVEDRGIGITRNEQQKIFERFHRVGNGLVHDVKGSGLGLSIVSHIVAAHGGRVTVASEPGRGSTFAIHLPAETRPDGDAPDQAPLRKVG